jgi:hypothetical protein
MNTRQASYVAHGVLCLCTLPLFTLATEGRLGLPRFEDAGLGASIASYGAFVASIIALAVTGAAFLAGRKLSGAWLIGIGAVPAAVGVACGLSALFASRPSLGGNPVEGVLLRLRSESALAPASVGLAGSACALLLVLGVAVLGYRAEFRDHGLDAYRSHRRSYGRVVAIVVAMVVGLVLAMSSHRISPIDFMSRDFAKPDVPRIARWGAVAFWFVVATVGIGSFAPDIELTWRLEEEVARNRLWWRAALIPASAATSILCLESSFLLWGELPLAPHYGLLGVGARWLPWADAAWVLAIGCAALWASRRASGLRLVALVAPVTVTGAAVAALIALEARAAWATKEADKWRISNQLPVVVAVTGVTVRVVGPGHLLLTPELDIFNAGPSDLLLTLLEGEVWVGEMNPSGGATLTLDAPRPLRAGEHATVSLLMMDLTTEDIQYRPNEAELPYRVQGSAWVGLPHGKQERIRFRSDGVLKPGEQRALFGRKPPF